MIKTCLWCNKEFATNRSDKVYCVRSHMKKAQNRKKHEPLKPKNKKECPECKKMFFDSPSRGKRFCNKDCRFKFWRRPENKRDTSYLDDNFKKIMSDNTVNQWKKMSNESKQELIKKMLFAKGWNGWSTSHVECVSCGKTNNKHVGLGFCVSCYNKKLRKEYWDKFDVFYFRENKFFGNLGMLKKENDHLQCHLCGEYFESLGVHVVSGHKWTVEDYKREFGLNRGEPLLSERMRKILSETLKETEKKYGLFDEVAFFRYNPGFGSNPTSKKRLQFKLNSVIRSKKRWANASQSEKNKIAKSLSIGRDKYFKELKEANV